MSQLTRPATLVNRGAAIVKPDSSSSPALTHTQYKEFQEEIAALITKFGIDRIKSMINRQPEPNPRGRPKKWDYINLFSLWCVIQSFAQDNTQTQEEIEKIRNSCRLLKQHGGSAFHIHFHQGQSFRGVATVERWRRLYYEAEEKFSQYEMQYKEAITLSREQHPPLKERLRMHVEDNVGCWSHRSGPDRIILETMSALQWVKTELWSDGVLRGEIPAFFRNATMIDPAVATNDLTASTQERKSAADAVRNDRD